MPCFAQTATPLVLILIQSNELPVVFMTIQKSGLVCMWVNGIRTNNQGPIIQESDQIRTIIGSMKKSALF